MNNSIPDPGYKVGDLFVDKRSGSVFRIVEVNHNICQLGNDWEWNYAAEQVEYKGGCTRHAWWHLSEMEKPEVYYYKEDFEELVNS